MRKASTWPVLGLMTLLGLAAGCSAATGRYRDYRLGPEQTVAVDAPRYSVAHHAMIGGEQLALNLERECAGVVEYEMTTYEVETRAYETEGWWVATGTAAFLGLGGFAINEGETALFTSSGVFLGGAVISTTILSFMEAQDPFEEERMVDRQTIRDTSGTVTCLESWPSGPGRLIGPATGTVYPAHFDGQGRALVDLAEASLEFWEREHELMLEQPGVASWATFELDPRIRSSALAALQTVESRGAQTSATPETRAYTWLAPSDLDGEYLAFGAIRLESVMTRDGRYRFATDTTTREHIERIVQSGGGSRSTRFLEALAAANDVNVSRVFELAVRGVQGDGALLVLSVYDAPTADRLVQLDAPVDLSQPWQVVEATEHLAEAFLVWEGER